jgi:paraquat-inducible protein A
MLKVQQFGHHHQTSVLGGISALFANRQVVVGAIVLLCSVVFPVTKLAALLALTFPGAAARLAHHHKAFTYRLIELTGRWGMLDVLLVAVLVALLKLGNVMDVTAGPAALAFSACVTLSLLAAAFFDPRQLWIEDQLPTASPQRPRSAIKSAVNVDA